MTPQDVEIIKAKHGHGLTPAVIAKQLEIPAREVAKVTGRLPIGAKISREAILAVTGGKPFTCNDIADALFVEASLVSSHMSYLASKGRARRVGRAYINDRHVTVWDLGESDD